MFKSRIFILITIFLALLSSCATVESTPLSPEDEERAISAIQLLSSDMLEQVDVEIKTESLEPALSQSYQIYSEYVPLYEAYKNDYLDSIIFISLQNIPKLYPYIYSEMVVLSENPDLYIREDTSLTEGLEKKIKPTLVSTFRDILIEYNDALQAAFKPSKDEFDSIRDAYLNLYSVDGGITLSDVMPANINVISEKVVDALFASLAAKEMELKNRVIDRNSDSLYSIFWEGRK